MGRPRIHHTPEEVQAADRAKSKRYYNKQKRAIAVQRGLKHRDKTRRSYIVYAPSVSLSSSNEPPKGPIRGSPAEYWCDRVEQANLKFHAFVGSSAQEYIDKLCTAYLTTNYDKNTIRDPLTTIANLRTRIRKYQEKILQLSGAGSEWIRSEEISQSLTAVVTSLEEVLCLGEGDQDELATYHAEGSLWYQRHYV